MTTRPTLIAIRTARAGARSTGTARTARSARTSRAPRAPACAIRTEALPSGATGYRWTTRRAHLIQLFHLVRRQELRELGLGFGFQSGELLELVCRQVEYLRRARRQQVKPATRGADRDHRQPMSAPALADGGCCPSGGGLLSCAGRMQVEAPKASARRIMFVFIFCFRLLCLLALTVRTTLMRQFPVER